MYSASIQSVATSDPVEAGPKRQWFWENILVLVMTHLLALCGIAYVIFVSFSWWTIGLALLWLTLCVLSTTGGYHRLFAHRTYQASKGVRLFYLLFGAASGQGSALRWASDHRLHHAHTDEAEDPHNIKRGFWWAHVGWLLYRSPPLHLENTKDLQADPLIRFQDRFYLLLAVLVGFGVPTLLAAAWRDPLGGLLLAGFLRLAIQYQATFSINSVAHWVGRQPYSKDTSARDSWVAAIVTLGEGYHNYHHTFPGDYRNGQRLHQFDPTKWWIWLLSKVGAAWDLRRVPRETVLRVRQSHDLGRDGVEIKKVPLDASH